MQSKLEEVITPGQYSQATPITQKQENEPDKYWWPGHHDYDPEHSSGIYQKTLGLSYTDFISPMIKAIQELSAKVEKLEKA